MLIKSEKKFQFWGSYALIVAPLGVKFGMEEGIPLLHAKFNPIGATYCPCGAKKPQNWPLSNYRRFALRSMLLVTKK